MQVNLSLISLFWKKKTIAHHLNRFQLSVTKDALGHVCFKWAQLFQRDENVNFTAGYTSGRRDNQTDDRWSEMFTWAFSSGDLKMKNVYLCSSYINVAPVFIHEDHSDIILCLTLDIFYCHLIPKQK